MKTTLIISALFLGIAFPAPVRAESCAEIASRMAAQEGAQVVAVQANNDETACNIKLKVPGQNGQPPRLETRSVAK